MSLVEKALQKIQASRPAAPAYGAPAQPHPAPALALERPAVATPVAEPQPAYEPDVAAYPSRMVQINRERLREMALLPPATQERELSHQFRAIKRPLIRKAGAESTGMPRPQTVMVASALPGDGKTFTSLNLALSLAMEKDLRVLLVDADTPKPHLTRIFELQSEPGLLDLLTDPQRKVESCILRTDIPRLDLLPIGTQSETATELLASARMSEVVSRLATVYRRGIVLFDSPPILLTSESRALAALLGQIVLVIKAGTTPQQAVKDAVDILGDASRISLVLNQADLGGLMGYYYGQRYGYGQAQAPKRGAAEASGVSASDGESS